MGKEVVFLSKKASYYFRSYFGEKNSFLIDIVNIDGLCDLINRQNRKGISIADKYLYKHFLPAYIYALELSTICESQIDKND